MHTGIDMGLKCTAVVSMNNDGVILHKVSFGSDNCKELKEMIKGHPADRYHLYSAYLSKYFIRNNITGTVVMENPMGRMIGHGRKVVELKGVYLLTLSRLMQSHLLFMPTPTEIKQFWTGSGRANKEKMLKHCRLQGYKPKHDHEGDAIAMARMSLEGVI